MAGICGPEIAHWRFCFQGNYTRSGVLSPPSGIAGIQARSAARTSDSFQPYRHELFVPPDECSREDRLVDRIE